MTKFQVFKQILELCKTSNCPMNLTTSQYVKIFLKRLVVILNKCDFSYCIMKHLKDLNNSVNQYFPNDPPGYYKAICK